MINATKNGHAVSGTWKTLVLGNGDTPESVRVPAGQVLVPLRVWKARRAELVHREYEHGWPLGIWLSAEEGAEEIADDIDDFTVIAVESDNFSDASAYATARALRERYGYTGELRVIGDAPNDCPVYRQQAGFNTSTIRNSLPVANLAIA